MLTEHLINLPDSCMISQPDDYIFLGDEYNLWSCTNSLYSMFSNKCVRHNVRQPNYLTLPNLRINQSRELRRFTHVGSFQKNLELTRANQKYSVHLITFFEKKPVFMQIPLFHDKRHFFKSYFSEMAENVKLPEYLHFFRKLNFTFMPNNTIVVVFSKSN